MWLLWDKRWQEFTFSPHHRHVLLPCWCGNTKEDIKPQATKFPLNVNRQHICKSIPRMQQQTFTELAASVKEIIEIIPVPTVTSDVEYSPSCFLCCLHLRIPSRQDPQSGLGHHHRNRTQGFPLVLRVTDSNTQVGKREKTHNTARREKQMCQFNKSIKRL